MEMHPALLKQALKGKSITQILNALRDWRLSLAGNPFYNSLVADIEAIEAGTWDGMNLAVLKSRTKAVLSTFASMPSFAPDVFEAHNHGHEDEGEKAAQDVSPLPPPDVILTGRFAISQLLASEFEVFDAKSVTHNEHARRLWAQALQSTHLQGELQRRARMVAKGFDEVVAIVGLRVDLSPYGQAELHFDLVY